MSPRTESLTINTIIEDVITMDTHLRHYIDCFISWNCYWKWVGLTADTAIERQLLWWRNISTPYLWFECYKNVGRINDIFFSLVKTIVNFDAKQFKNQHPEYFINPVYEIRQSLSILKNKPIWKERYQKFIESMVYDNAFKQDYDDSIKTIENISEKAMTEIYEVS